MDQFRATQLPCFAPESASQCKICKVIVMGPSGVGKSTFIRQYIEKKFHEGLVPTAGCKYCN